MSMELRHLRSFLVLAEELHFGRAAEKLHIDQSPLSRTIKELEDDLGARLFARTTRSTRLTRAGQALVEHAIRVFDVLDQARSCVADIAAGRDGQLRVALSDGASSGPLAALLARCREDEPDLAIKLREVTFAQQVSGLHEELFDAGFARSDEVGPGLVTELAWSEPLCVAMPARHPLLAHKRIPIDELLKYPIVLGHPDSCSGCRHQIGRMLHKAERKPMIADHVRSPELMMALVAAGLGLGLAGASRMYFSRSHNLVARPLAGRQHCLRTWLLRREGDAPHALTRFIARVHSLRDLATTDDLLARSPTLPEDVSWPLMANDDAIG